MELVCTPCKPFRPALSLNQPSLGPMASIGQKTQHAGQTWITLTGIHARCKDAQARLTHVSAWLQCWFNQTAEQFKAEIVWQCVCDHIKQVIAGINTKKLRRSAAKGLLLAPVNCSFWVYGFNRNRIGFHNGVLQPVMLALIIRFKKTQPGNFNIQIHFFPLMRFPAHSAFISAYDSAASSTSSHERTGDLLVMI